MGRPETPTDQLSGLPLLLLPNDQVLRLLLGLEDNSARLADWNHAYHPAAQVLAGGDGSEAVRQSRKQFVLRAHHDNYHGSWYGPPLPRTPAERFKAVTLCAAGYIPPQALDTTSRRGRIVTLTDVQRERLRVSGEVQVASFSIVQKFLRDFVLAQPTDHINATVVDRFLGLDPVKVEHVKERRYLAHLLLSLVIDRAEEPLDDAYRFGHTYQLLKPGLPTRPGDFVKSIIIRNSKNIRQMTGDLRKKLIVQREGGKTAQGLGNLAMA